ncbi:heterotrimeric G protein alpha subunit [Tricholoma matsutake]|nr:heterotrimeric G protein alpha subunit [Tricholoma matsutake 945]
MKFPSSDPFIEFMLPPPDETPAQKTARLKRELDAQQVSDRIDEEIKQERLLAKKEKNVIKVLLLGQAESGKSTTLKNFRMRFAQSAWEKERNGWRAVVQLNIVRSITTLLEAVESEMRGDPAQELDEEVTQAEAGDVEELQFNETHSLLMIRLTPLRGVETLLKRRLGPGAEPHQPELLMAATPFDQPSERSPDKPSPEFTVRSWQEVLDAKSRTDDMGEDLDSATLTFAACKNDMKTLWNDKTVRLALKRRNHNLPDSAGFFLNDLERIASRDYVVSDDDIVRARLRTVGIQEYRLHFTHSPWAHPKKVGGRESGWEWRIFDVGGCRTSRAAWLPFFDNVNVIIFLSPVSVFDQRLEEDPRVNRLEDSIILWKSICSAKLLAKTQLILFLNKCDLLKRKLKRGIQVNRHLPSYGNKPNEIISVVKYLREKFKDIQRQYSPEPRSTYIFATTVTDTGATLITLESVRDFVLRDHLATSQLI